MHVSPLEEYGLRCAIQLAKLWTNKGHLSASRIAELEGLSVEYVSKIMYLFRKSGLARSVRGIDGGFLLQKAPQETPVLDVFRALKSKEDEENFCNHFRSMNFGV